MKIQVSFLAATSLFVSTATFSGVFDLPPGGTWFQNIASNIPQYGNVWKGIGQSFVALDSRTQFSFYYRSQAPDAFSFKVQLFDGEGSMVDVLLQQNVTVASGEAYRTGLVNMDFSSVSLLPGRSYTVLATLPGGGLPSIGINTEFGFDMASTPSNFDPYANGYYYMYGEGGLDLLKNAGRHDLAFKISPVPEAPTYLMLIFGLACLGSQGWHRASRNNCSWSSTATKNSVFI